MFIVVFSGLKTREEVLFTMGNLPVYIQQADSEVPIPAVCTIAKMAVTVVLPPPSQIDTLFSPHPPFYLHKDFEELKVNK